MTAQAMLLPSRRQGLGLLIFAAGAAIALWQLWYFLHQDMRVWHALLAGSVAAFATAVGALPALFSRRIPERLVDGLLGFGAGVMLAACAFSLIVPGLEEAQSQGHSQWEASLIVGGGILLGSALLLLLDRYLPHEHFIKGVEGPDGYKLKRIWLFVFAVMLHNIPEGLAIGVAFVGSSANDAASLTTGIAIQDMPEGLVVSMALVGVGYRRRFAVLIGVLSGLTEPLAAVIGAILAGVSSQLLPWGLAFSAGAMLFVISHEIIPESHRKGHERHATSGLMLGFVLMMWLDTALV